jgi:hypothetical protein
MTDEERAALAALRLNWVPVPDDVWRPSPFHVDGLHSAVAQAVLDGMAEAAELADGSPVGLVLQGQRGAGKTHLLGWVRQQIQAQGGYFFLVSLLDAKGFWDSVLASMLDGLYRPVSGGESQLRLLLRRLSSRVGAPRSARRAVVAEIDLTRPALDAFVEGLTIFDEYVARTSQETARALALSASVDVTHRDVAENYFAHGEEATPGERGAWGMRRMPKTSQEIVQELSRLLALTGPSIIAVDQIDTLIAQSALSGDRDHATASAMNSVENWEQSVLLERIAGGLMDLRERTRRTLAIVACLPASWTLIKVKATDTVRDRFRESEHVKEIGDSDLSRQIVKKRFAVPFKKIGFEPPYSTWPVADAAFSGTDEFTPRQLLIKIDEHIRSCLLDGEIRELTRLGRPPASESSAPEILPSSIAPDELAKFDARFDALKKSADVTTPLESDTEDATVPGLLAAGLGAWILERGGVEPDTQSVFRCRPR